MELLSPAGNLKHIDLAIEKKVDAVYGGLKEWNARNKAMNFSIEEYNKVVKQLHNNGIKFYLTLNTLVFDEEIEDIMNFLERKDTVLPDAFIIADIGLIKKINNKFPNVPLHFSTQFGIHNITDCKFAENLGAERAILARELTFNEINNIKANTKLEIENFVWGSQCISFSGLCFFGSIINCGNGNRGKCIITCRDIYQVENNKGHFLYVPDLDCTAMINKLDDIGIDCIKLEGRRRNPKELSNIIDDIRSNNYKKEQNGYIYGEKLKDNKLHEQINNRIKPICNIRELTNITPYDVFIKYENKTPKEFLTANWENVDNENIYYVFSEYKKYFKFDKKNISIDLNISGDIIQSILYVNSKGEGKTFDGINENDYTIFEIEKFITDISMLDEDINLYKLKYIRNKENTYKISKKLYNEILKYICNDNKNRIINKTITNEDFKIKNLLVETDNIDYAIRLKEIPSIKVIYNIATIENFKHIKEIVNILKNNVIYKLPLFNFKSIDLSEYYNILKNKSVMFTRPAQLFETKNIEFDRKYIDYTIYVWNAETVKFLREYKIDEITASPELSYEKNREILKGQNIQYIVAGKLPLVYTRQCFSHLYGCNNCEKNRAKVKEMVNLDKNIKFKIICNQDYRMIIADSPMLNNFQYFKNCDDINFRYVTTDQNINEILDTIDILKEKNYFNILKKTNIWKNSYEGNILESRC